MACLFAVMEKADGEWEIPVSFGDKLLGSEDEIGMSRQEFLNVLRVALGTELGVAAVEENVKYYEEYINAQIRMGKSEEEVLAMLGSPKLIARSIIEANRNSAGGGKQDTAGYDSNGYGNSGYGNGGYGNSGYGNSGNGNSGYGGTERKNGSKVGNIIEKNAKRGHLLLAAAAVCLVLVLLVLVVWWLAPVIITVWLAVFLFKLLRRK